MHGDRLSDFARAVLRKIGDGRKNVARDDGSAIIGNRAIPQSVIALLLERDLVCRTGNRFDITDAGRHHLRRMDPIPAPRAGERISPFRAQHMQIARASRRRRDDGRQMLVNTAESPLGRLSARRGKDGAPLLSERQRLAGERLREDFELACLMPRITRPYDAPPMARARRGASSCQAARAASSDTMLEARRRVHRALDAVGGGLDDILIRVCCFLEGLEEAERTLGWPVRSAKVVLRIALDRLADHYDGKKKGARRRPSVQEMQV